MKDHRFSIDEKVKKSLRKPDDLSSSDDGIPDKPSKSSKKETWSVRDVYDTSSSEEENDEDEDAPSQRSR
jgi:hypothetical protein